MLTSTRTNNQLIAIAGAAFLIVTWLLVGVYRDNEFYEPDLFLKHRPAFQVSFYSPVGMSDRKVSVLIQKISSLFDQSHYCLS
jgi:hypothetical protein